MRPCRQCRTPIENNVAVCPQCGAAQDERAKPSGPVPPPVLRRRLFRRAPPAPQAGADPPRPRGFVVRLIDSLAGEALMYLVLLVALGATVGGALAGMRGAIVGGAAATATIVLAFVVLSLLSSSEG
jgi:hypothetical protein